MIDDHLAMGVLPELREQADSDPASTQPQSHIRGTAAHVIDRCAALLANLTACVLESSRPILTRSPSPTRHPG